MTRMSYRYKVCLKCQHYPCKKEKECIEVNLKTMQIYFNNFDRKTEPTISKMEQVDWKDQMWKEACREEADRLLETQMDDEPQTERSK